MAVIPVPAKFSFVNVSKFTLLRASNIIRSRYSGARQVISYPFAIWQLEATLVDYDSTQAALIRSFLSQLDGQKNTFRLPVPGYTKPSSGYVGNGLVSVAAAARASSITVGSLTASVPVINEGDYFMVNDELKIATSSVASNGGGIAVITFKPPLRKALTVGMTVAFQNPTILMHAANDDVASWGITPPYRHNIKFMAIEAIEL